MKIFATTILSAVLAMGLMSSGPSNQKHGCCGKCDNNGGDVYMFTSFHEPADEGLRFLYSEDGVHWDSIAGTWLKPEIGQNIMRDPSIVVGPDGTYHQV